ncbi:SAM-dependent methyltransferase [Streptomyces aurantiacus]|uniref:SAM-dependent methyltransferase n=2 Tax=Streptomyces aurantiacus TaxID=47760 RepID=A0A7G1PEG9_9ACTN|nr:SAM-dependent methyltransferase [Streptomyces aurantiacus]
MPQRGTPEVEWQRAGAATDTTLPDTTPVVEAILERLPALPVGSVVLDLACGTGQPTFVLARDRPGLKVLGVDVTPVLIEQAQEKARANSVQNASFGVMSVDQLELEDRSMDAAISHFGLLQEGNLAASGHELARVLAPGAPFSFATFDDMALNTLMSTIERILSGHVPADTLPDFDYLTRLAVPGLRERVLREARLEQFHTAIFRWSVPLPSFDAVWQIASGPVPFARAFDALDSADVGRVRSDLEDAVSQYRNDGGAFVFPMACRLFWGHR